MDSCCPLCGTKDHTIIFNHLQQYPNGSIAKCNHCLHIYTILIQSLKTDKLYNDRVYKVVENRNSIFDKILSWEYNKVLKTIHSFKPSKGKLLDFGSGKGKFASLAKKKGWEVKCVEITIERATYAKNIYNLEVSTDFYTTDRIFNVDFEVLTLFHVLEHLPQPKILLDELIKHNLTKDGLVLIEVPNFNSLQARMAGRNWMHLDVPRHINHFTPIQLEKIAQELNLSTLKTSFFSFHLGVLGMIDCFLKLFGYRKHIIHELKNQNHFGLLLIISILLPFALIIEYFAAATGNGGIVRKYFIRQ